MREKILSKIKLVLKVLPKVLIKIVHVLTGETYLGVDIIYLLALVVLHWNHSGFNLYAVFKISL